MGTASSNFFAHLAVALVMKQATAMLLIVPCEGSVGGLVSS
jgi:hypothetical protein